MQEPQHALAPTPKILESESDSFEILSVLGQGGMGIVYKAHQANFDRTVAIKMLRPGLHSDQQQQIHKLLKEAKATALLDHENIVKIYSVSQSVDGQLFISMEYVDGTTLSHVIQSEGALGTEQFYNIFGQVFQALMVAHHAGVVHRDIKPSNILVTASGAVKLADFGIAKLLNTAVQQHSTQTGSLLGTPWYMSPEQCQGKSVDSRSDLYALGCVMHEALTGHYLFDGVSSLEVMFKHLHEQPPPITKPISPLLRKFISRLLEKSPENRYRSTDEAMAAFLESRCDATVSASSTPRPRPRLPSKLITRPGLLVVSLACGAAIAWYATYLQASHHENTTPTVHKPAYYYCKRGIKLSETADTLKYSDPHLAAQTQKLALAEFSTAMESAANDKNFSALVDIYLSAGRAAMPIDRKLGLSYFALARKTADEHFRQNEHECLRVASLTGQFYLDDQQAKTAEKIYRKALSGCQNIPGNVEVARLEEHLGSALLLEKKPLEAESHCRKALRILTDLDIKNMDRASVLATLGNCLFDLHRPSQAAPYFAESAQLYMSLDRPKYLLHPYLEASRRLALCLSVTGKNGQARHICQRAIENSDLLRKTDPEVPLSPHYEELVKLLKQLESTQ